MSPWWLLAALVVGLLVGVEIGYRLASRKLTFGYDPGDKL